MNYLGPFAKNLPFHTKSIPFTKPKQALWFIFQDDKIALQSGNPYLQVPFFTNADLPFKQTLPSYYIGTYNETDCIGIELPVNETLPTTIQFYSFRSLLSSLPVDLYTIAGRAKQLTYFHHSNQYCGKCGTKTDISNVEDARICPACSHIFYPRLSPVVIMTVVKENKLLLARSPHFPKGMFSCLAGFIEPGETAEEAIVREVHEETGVKVKNIQYVTSQPWPFPHSLMFGFSAEYDQGNLQIDHDEIEEAAWFSTDNLPPLPSGNSIARYLINLVIAARTK